MNLIKKISANRNAVCVFLVLLTLGIVSRLLTHYSIHPANFSVVGALALFGGFYFKKGWGVAMPVAIMLITDVIFGFYQPGIMAAVYLCLIFNALLGSFIKNKIMGRSVFFSLFGSVVFFLVTNFAVWSLGGWYEHSMNGLVNCYTMALPFFRNSLIGDLFYALILFGAYEFAANYVAEKKLETV